MRNQGVLEINNLNQEFYKNHEESFSKSRDLNFWKGFFFVLKYIKSETNILDLGCGNGRFLQFLLEKSVDFKSYLGVDSTIEFIKQNKEKYQQGNFHTQDIFEYENFQKIGSYNLVVIFGVTHHIASKEFRINWFKNLNHLVEKNGVLVLSFWKFDILKSYKFIPNFYKIEENDYFLGWKKDFSNLRFCHFYNLKEINEIKRTLKNFKVIQECEADSNTYIVLQKN